MAKRRRSRAFKENDQVIDFEEERQKRKEKRKQLQQKKKVRNPESATISGRHASKKAKRRLIYSAVFLIILVIVSMSVYNIVNLRQEREAAEKNRLALEKERDKLQKELSLADSDEYIEEVARDELSMIRAGEKIYVLPETTAAAADSSTGEALTTSGAAALVPEEQPLDGTEEEGILSKVKEVLGTIISNLNSLLRK